MWILEGIPVFLLLISVFAIYSDLSKHRNYHLLDHEDCGLYVTSRIIGGDNAEFGQYPWVALFTTNNSKPKSRSVVVKCGATVISKRYLLTAAHCVHEDVQSLTVVIGEYNLDEDPDCGRAGCAPPAQRTRVEEALVHPGYDHYLTAKDYNSPHDIALVRTDVDIQFNDFIQPICLPFYDKNIPDAEKCYSGEVAGWGSNSRYGMLRLTPILQHLSAHLVSPSECSFTILEGQFCVATERSKDTCDGDSGGPLMRIDFHPRHFVPRYFLIGVLSFGKSICAYNRTPMAVYTNITDYLEWILDSIKL